MIPKPDIYYYGEQQIILTGTSNSNTNTHDCCLCSIAIVAGAEVADLVIIISSSAILLPIGRRFE